MSTGPIIIGVLGVCVMCSSSVAAAALMMGGEETTNTTGPTGPTGSGGSGGSGGPPCERGKSITGQTGSLGACRTINDIKPNEITFQGNFFSPRNPTRGVEWVHELSSTANKKEFIASHQSPDNWCKMVRFEVSKDGDNCNYKLLDAGYTTSPTNASTCTTKTAVLGHWASKNVQSLATADDQDGYGIQNLKYDKYC